MKLSSCFVQSSDVQKCMPHGPEIFVSRFKYQWITSTNLNLSFPVLLACNLVLCCLLKYYLLNANWAPTLHLHLTLRFHQRHRLIFLNTHLVYLNVLIDIKCGCERGCRSMISWWCDGWQCLLTCLRYDADEWHMRTKFMIYRPYPCLECRKSAVKSSG